ncbi:MAG: hypothetical protein ABIG70_09885 [Pseudomonadota bacterium]
MATTIPPIKEFQVLPENTIWRVDWFGAVEKNINVESEPKIQIILSQVTFGYQADPASDSVVDHSTRRTISIGVGQLPAIYIGSFWRNGRRLPSRAGEKLTFTVDINQSTVGHVASTGMAGGQYLIPYNEHRVSGDGKKAKCVTISYNGDPAGIIIPVAELIRFYYATSTSLSKSVFKGDFHHALSRLVNIEFTGMNGTTCVVYRAKDITNDDCWTIGRILNSREALDSVKKIHDSMMIEHKNNLPAYPESGFPFSGTTTITALCKSIGPKSHRRFLVLSLLSCTGPFPYDELEVIENSDQASPETDIPDDEKKAAWSGAKKAYGSAKDAYLQSESEPEAGVSPIRIDEPGDRFAAIKGKAIKKTPKEKCKYKSGALKCKLDKEIKALGTGDGDYRDGGVTPARIDVEKDRKYLPASFDTLVDMATALSKYPGFNACLRPFGGEAGIVCFECTKSANRRQWAYLDFQEKTLRGMMVVDIVMQGRHFCVFEIEPRPKAVSDSYLAELIYKPDGSAITPDDMRELVTLLVRSDVEGRLLHVKKLPGGLLHQGMVHRWKDANEYATVVAETINGVVTAVGEDAGK